MNNKTEKNIIFFDSECLMCNKYVLFVNKFDKEDALYFAPIKGISYKELKLNEEFGSVDSILFYNQGHTSAKTDAILKLTGHLIPALKPLTTLLTFVPKFIRDGLYDFVARNRYRLFGKIEQCALIPASIRKNILD